MKYDIDNQYQLMSDIYMGKSEMRSADRCKRKKQDRDLHRR
jgi:hypothetical protein